MNSLVSSVTRSATRSPAIALRAAVTLLASLCAQACSPAPEPGATVPLVGSDAGVVVSPDGAVLALIAEVRLRVVGVTGSGLTVKLGNDENYTVPADGTYNVKLSGAVTDVAPLVLVQPEGPAQTCEFDKLSDGEYALTCTARRYHVRGTVEGLAGSGLVLTSQSNEVLSITASGEFEFSELLDEGAAYTVTVSGDVTAPRQMCAVSNGSGRINGGVSADLKVSCATNSYFITTNVSGLTEPGLQIKVTDGSIIPVPKAGVFKYDIKFPDGYQYNLDIYQQPDDGDANTSQRCFVQDGHGKIDGGDVEINIICDALGDLRISEVGSCPYSNSACWFEIYNSGKLAEQLTFYKLRTSAISGSKVYKEYEFSLPFVTVPPQSFVVVQAAVASALPDGSNVLHVSDGTIVPWWSTGGFIELTSKGVTSDFVRWGASTMEPITGGTWGGGSAPALPSGANSYGYSIAHIPRNVAVSSADAWLAHAFSTPAGNNDVTTDVDADSDGIPDTAEVSGGTFAGINVFAMGARTGQKDVFVEIDRMDSTDPALIPRKEALDKLVQVYKRRNIAVHYDVGNLFVPSFDPASYNLGGGNVVAFSKGISLGASTTPGLVNSYSIKATNMVGPRRSFFYYQLFASTLQADGTGGSSGIGEQPGNDSIITLGGFKLSTANKVQTNLLINYQAATMMHELGHNLGLKHGGSDEINRKPNYVSVMNYLYSPLGLPTIGVTAEGDRYDIYERCSVFSVQQLTNSPAGDVSKFVLDYSDGLSADIDESELLEIDGLGRTNSQDIDYNCNGVVDAKYGRDLNQDSKMNLLADNDDWASLTFIFRRTASGVENGNTLQYINPGIRNDVCTADTLHKTDLPCGHLSTELLDGVKQPAE